MWPAAEQHNTVRSTFISSMQRESAEREVHARRGAPVVGAGCAAGGQLEQARQGGGGAGPQHRLRLLAQAAHQRLDDGVELGRQRAARHRRARQAACAAAKFRCALLSRTAWFCFVDRGPLPSTDRVVANSGCSAQQPATGLFLSSTDMAGMEDGEYLRQKRPGTAPTQRGGQAWQPTPALPTRWRWHPGSLPAPSRPRPTTTLRAALPAQRFRAAGTAAAVPPAGRAPAGTGGPLRCTARCYLCGGTIRSCTIHEWRAIIGARQFPMGTKTAKCALQYLPAFSPPNSPTYCNSSISTLSQHLVLERTALRSAAALKCAQRRPPAATPAAAPRGRLPRRRMLRWRPRCGRVRWQCTAAAVFLYALNLHKACLLRCSSYSSIYSITMTSQHFQIPAVPL